MKLAKISKTHIDRITAIHVKNDGDLINASLDKLFHCMNDNANSYEVAIKVAALNKIYSTAIQYIPPVVKNIVSNVTREHSSYTLEEYAELVDKISLANWKNKTTGKKYSRNNISFSSKYVHFISLKKVPIYDSYIWIVMIGYLNQYAGKKYKFTEPKKYSEFYELFVEFKNVFKLNKYCNYSAKN